MQKAFQVSIELPPFTNIGSYWEALLSGRPQTSPRREDPATLDRVRSELAECDSLTALDEKLETVRETEPGMYHLWVIEALRRESSPDLRIETRHALQDFSALLDRNPRAMKRFVNAYGIHRAAIRYADALYGVELEEPWKQLALWTIVEMRWPSLAEHMREAPEILQAIVDGHGVPDGTSVDIRHLVVDPKVLQVLKGEELGVSLSETAVRAFFGFQQVVRHVAGTLGTAPTVDDSPG